MTFLTRQAKNSGKFTAEEMQALQREFQHHKDKIHEYNVVMDTISRTEGEHDTGPGEGTAIGLYRMRG